MQMEGWNFLTFIYLHTYYITCTTALHILFDISVFWQHLTKKIMCTHVSFVDIEVNFSVQ